MSTAVLEHTAEARLRETVRLATIEECGALLGNEAVRLLGQRDREDVEGIARASAMVRSLASRPPPPLSPLLPVLAVARRIMAEHKPIDPDNNKSAAVPWELIHLLADVLEAVGT